MDNIQIEDGEQATPENFTPLGSKFPQLLEAWRGNKHALLSTAKEIFFQDRQRPMFQNYGQRSFDPQSDLEAVFRQVPHYFDYRAGNSQSLKERMPNVNESRLLTNMEAVFGPYYKLDGDTYEKTIFVPIIDILVDRPAKAGVSTEIEFEKTNNQKAQLKFKAKWLGILKSSEHKISTLAKFPQLKCSHQLALPIEIALQAYENHYNGDKRYTASIQGVGDPIRAIPGSLEYNTVCPADPAASAKPFMGHAMGGSLVETLVKGEGFAATSQVKILNNINFEMQYRSEVRQRIRICFTSNFVNGLQWQQWNNSKGLYRFSL